MKIDIKAVYARILQRLRATGLSAYKASKNAGLSGDAIRNIQRAAASGAKKGVTAETIAALADALGTTPGWLMEGKGEESTGEADLPDIDGGVAGRIEAVRKRIAGLTLAAFAVEIGVTRQAVGAWEAGKANISAENLLAIAEKFDVPLDWLRTGTGRPPAALATPLLITGPTEARQAPALIPALRSDAPTFAGNIQAGAWFDVADDDFNQDIVHGAARTGNGPRLFEWRVIGDSMNLAGIDHGDTIIGIDWLDIGGDVQDGMTAVIERRDNTGRIERTCKEVRVFPDRYELHPRSSNPKHTLIRVDRASHVDERGCQVAVLAKVTKSVRSFR